MKHLIKNVAVVNEGKITFSDVLISNQRIEKIATSITKKLLKVLLKNY